MSDQKLRELECRWRETGSVEDEAAYLRQRVRVGDLTQERLELAAYCGHEGASAATNLGPPRLGLEGWACGLSAFGQAVSVRALVALGRLQLATWELLYPEDHTQREALESAEQWLLSQAGPRSLASAKTASYARERAYLARICRDPDGSEYLAASVAAAAAFAAAAECDLVSEPERVSRAELCLQGCVAELIAWGAPELTEDTARNAMTGSLIEWALGLGASKPSLPDIDTPPSARD